MHIGKIFDSFRRQDKLIFVCNLLVDWVPLLDKYRKIGGRHAQVGIFDGCFQGVDPPAVEQRLNCN